MKYRLLLNKKKQITMQKNQRSEGTRVAVIGGGTAGVFAAIVAAKNGADTVLIEKEFPAGRFGDRYRSEFSGAVFCLGKTDD